MTHIAAFVLLSTMLVIAAITDSRHGKVHNWLTYPAMLVGLAYWGGLGWAGGPTGVGHALAGLFTGLVPLALVRQCGGLGGGDVKLMGAVGALSASWACVLSTAIYALTAGVLMAIGVVLCTGRTMRTVQRLFGAALAVSSGATPTVDDSDSPRIPFGLAIAAGGLLAGAEQLLGWQSPWAWLSP